ncbi:MAG: OmpA family protein [Chitinophagales bacterium]|nr:OmpA family protein [Bacteroidota bacterium]MBK8488465.1 OmpA family protein [Bacteroidota bacterium]MBK8681772.1 OmpA family protein [Bacteroidota bacterium]
MKKLFLISGCIALLIWGCKYTENITDGQTAYNLKKYSLAAELLEKEFNKDELGTTKAQLAYQIGQSYQYNNQTEAAATWYKTAIDWEYGSDAVLAFAKMLKAQEKYNEAIKQFQAYLIEEPYRRPEITAEITSSENALTWIKADNDEFDKEIYITNLKTLNSADADFSPAFSSSTSIAFTSSRENSTGDLKDKWTGNKFYDVYEATFTGYGKFNTPQLYSGKVNSEYNDGSLIFSSDFTEMFFTRCGSDDRKIDDYCNLYYSAILPEGGWSEPEVLPFFEDSLNIGTACLSIDGQTLFFAAMGPNGLGGSDIYYSKRLFEGWDTPVNGGTSINTVGNEAFPNFDAEGNFYFASDGHPGMGGLDIFSASFNKGKFSGVTNMKYPINSGADDFGMMIVKQTKDVSADTLMVGYFSSARKGGVGGDDLYMFVKKPKKLRAPVFVLNGKINQKVYEDTSDVTSTVIDTISLPGAIATIGFSELNTLLAKFVLPIDSSFNVIVDSLKTYKFSGAKEGYFTGSKNISITGYTAKPGDTLIIYSELVLDKIPSSKEAQIKLNNIYYDYDDTTLRAESFPELDKLVVMLTENPNLTIQINSHTDSRGSDKYNQKLSQGRANSVVVYLILKGIDSERLFAKGFGESNPDKIKTLVTVPSGTVIPKNTILTEKYINGFKSKTDDFEFLHQLNRRTTFNIVSDTFNLNSDAPDEIEVDPAPENNEIKDNQEKQD